MKSRNVGILAVGLLFVATIADIKYKGLFYQMLPGRIQTKLDRFI